VRAAGFAVTTATLRDVPYVSHAEPFDLVTLPGYGGLDLVPVILKLAPKTLVIVLSGDDRYEALALAAGAHGFVLKGTVTFTASFSCSSTGSASVKGRHRASPVACRGEGRAAFPWHRGLSENRLQGTRDVAALWG
jgi:hypothetical protein